MMPLEAPAKTHWWHKNPGDEGKVVCTLCPRECHIPAGSRGFCFVRANMDGELVLTTYGRSSGYCIDPIEKKPLNHFLPGTPVLSFGTAGCNLGCKFCQNWDISKSRQMDQIAEHAAPEAVIDAAQSTGCRSVAFTYNDPVIWAEYAIDIAKVARRRRIKTVAVTAGYIAPEARKEFYKWIDAANIDLKAFTETFYRKLTQTHLEPVLDTLRYLKHETDVWFEITNLIIPEENDGPEEIERMCCWIVDNLGDDVPVHFTAFHPDFKMMDKPHTPLDTLIRARQQAIDVGIKFAYVGNVNDVQRQSTFCPGCRKLLIERDWYELGTYKLDRSTCGACGTLIPGRFENGRGNWGRKRVPIRVGQKVIDGDGKMPSIVTPFNDNPAPSSAAITEFTAEQRHIVLSYTRRVVEQTVRGEPIQASLPPPLDRGPVHGAFVTLKRATALRACRGTWSDPAVAQAPEAVSALGPLLASVAQASALHDTRFAAIQQQELEMLELEVSIMFDFHRLAERGAERSGGIAPGTHGLAINHPRGRGLLLPQIATENNWDAQTFLSQLCRKAGLASDDAWKDEEATITTFRAIVLADGPPKAEWDARTLNDSNIRFLRVAVDRMLHGQPVQDPTEPSLGEQLRQERGLHLQTSSGLTASALGANHSLIQLAQMATGSLKDLLKKRNKVPERIETLSLLWQPIRLRAQDYPRRHRAVGSSAVLAENTDGRWALILPPRDGLSDQVGQALSTTGLSQQQWQDSGARVTAFSVIRLHARSGHTGRSVRPAAHAGRFYPEQTDVIKTMIEKHLAADRSEQAEQASAANYRAVMLPHAGWLYCGDTIGKTLRRVKVPRTVIVIGPKHTSHGAAWSIAPHQKWQLPGVEVPIATDLAQRLLDCVSEFQCEPDAHKLEHGTEVLLPFLLRMNEQLRVLPVVLGPVDSYDALASLADALVDIVRGSEDPPLLVISSDMNHFAAEPENRRLDHMALDAMLTGDPRQLYDVVKQHDISMCGIHPAVAIMQALNKLGNPVAPQLVDYRNSAAVTGNTSSVVGYAGVLIK